MSLTLRSRLRRPVLQGALVAFTEIVIEKPVSYAVTMSELKDYPLRDMLDDQQNETTTRRHEPLFDSDANSTGSIGYYIPAEDTRTDAERAELLAWVRHRPFSRVFSCTPLNTFFPQAASLPVTYITVPNTLQTTTTWCRGRD